MFEVSSEGVKHGTVCAKQSQFAWAQNRTCGTWTNDGFLDSRSPIGSRTSFAGMTSQAAVQNKANLPFQAAEGDSSPCEAADGRLCETKPNLGGMGYLGQTRLASEGVAERNRACETKPIGGLLIAECGLKRVRALMRNKANSLGPRTDLVGPGRTMGSWIPASSGMTSQAAVQNKANLPFQAADGHGPPCEAADGRLCETKPNLGGLGYLGRPSRAGGDSHRGAEHAKQSQSEDCGLLIVECGLKRVRALVRNKANLPCQAAEGDGSPCEAADGRLCETKPNLGGLGHRGKIRVTSGVLLPRISLCETKPIALSALSGGRFHFGTVRAGLAVSRPWK
jgi:hypothetical protein